MSGPGHQHERAGERLLVCQGIPENVARFCVTHAAWDDDDCAVEDLLVALADKLWKLTRREPWDVFGTFDAICETIAGDGPGRLARSRL